VLVEEIIDAAIQLGISLSVKDNKLKFVARQNSFPDALKQQIRDHKQEVIAYLLAQQEEQQKREQEEQEQALNPTSNRATSQAATSQATHGSTSAITTLPRPLTTPPPLSYSQQRLWFLQQYMGPNPVYNIATAWKLQLSNGASVNPDYMLQSIERVIQRHDTLRTRFVVPEQTVEDINDNTYDEQPVQQIQPALAPLSLQVVQSDDELRQLRDNAFGYCFDLSQDDLCRVQLIHQQQADYYALIVVLHHSIADGWSLDVFCREVLIGYNALAARPASQTDINPDINTDPLPPLAIQYCDYSHWQTEQMHDGNWQAQLDYWRDQLSGAPALLALPTKQARPQEQTFSGANASISISENLVNTLRQLSQQHGGTLYMTLLASFGVLLSRYSGQTDICIGTPIANRNNPDTEAMIGFFSNTIVMRLLLDPELRFSDLIQLTREHAINAYANQDIPFEKVVEALSPQRSVSYSPLFQVMFVLQSATQVEPAPSSGVSSANETTLQFTELALSGSSGKRGGQNGKERESGKEGEKKEESTGKVSRFDMTFILHEQAPSASENKPGITGTLEYNTDLFEPEFIAQFLQHYENLLTQIASNITLPLSRLSVVDAYRQSAPVLATQSTAVNPALKNQGLHQLFEAQAERTPHAIALVYQNNTNQTNTSQDNTNESSLCQQLSYGELNRRATALAHELLAQFDHSDQRDKKDQREQQQKTLYETRIGICLERSPNMLIAMLAILKTGATYVPLDPDYPQSRLSYLIKDSQLALVIVSNKINDTTQQQHRDLFNNINVLDLCAVDFQQSHPCLNLPVHSKQLAYLIYTSGSTGNPKGVAISHSNVVAMLQWANQTFTAAVRERVLASTSMCFDLSIFELFLPVSFGTSVVLANNVLQLPELAMGQYITLLNTVPSAAEALLETQAIPHSVQCMNLAGEALSTALVNRLYQAADIAQIYDLYGPSEDTTYSTFQLRLPDEAASIGVPVANTQAFVLDGNLQICPMGVVGELYLAGEGLARGYLNRAAATAEKFIPHPFSQTPGQRLYSTGDLVRYNAKGQLFFIGRADHLVKIRGFRIELGEIEAKLLACGANLDPPIEKAVVIARSDLRSANSLDTEITNIKSAANHTHLAAYITTRHTDTQHNSENNSNQNASPGQRFIQQLQQQLRLQLPDYMQPGSISWLEAFPTTLNGKIDKKRLPAPAPSGSASHLLPNDLAQQPRGETEQILAGLWQQLLSVNAVQRHDNFFALGGHSLLATQLLARLRNLLNVELPMRALFEQQTLQEQAQLIDSTRAGNASPDNVSFDNASAQRIPAVVDTSVNVNREQERRSSKSNHASRSEQSPPIPLSYAQQRLWFLYRYSGANSVYNIPLALRFCGQVNIGALQQSLREIVARHSTLRSHFALHNGQGVQVISATLPELPLETVESDAALQNIAQQERHYGFELASETLSRIRLLQVTGSNDIALLITLHHSIADGWSLGVLYRELLLLYRHFNAPETQSAENILPPLPIQYADYALWQRTQTPEFALQQAQLTWWQQQLADMPPVLALPTDKPRPAEQTYNGSTARLPLSATLSQQLNSLAQQQGVTLYMLLLSAFAVLLQRYSNQQDFAIGSPIAGRSHEETEGLIGFFVNTLVMRCRVDPAQTFSELLRLTRETTLQAFANQAVPFEQLVDALNPIRDPRYSPLFQVAFVLQNTPFESVELDNVQITPLTFGESPESSRSNDTAQSNQSEEADHHEPAQAHFDLTLSVQEVPASGKVPSAEKEQADKKSTQLITEFEYNTDLFEPDSINAMLEQYAVLLQQIADAADQLASQPLHAFSFLNSVQQEKLSQGVVGNLQNQAQSNVPVSIASHLLSVDAKAAYVSEDLTKPLLGAIEKAKQQKRDQQINIGLLYQDIPQCWQLCSIIWQLGGCAVPVYAVQPSFKQVGLLAQYQVNIVLASPEQCAQLQRHGWSQTVQLIELDASAEQSSVALPELQANWESSANLQGDALICHNGLALRYSGLKQLEERLPEQQLSANLASSFHSLLHAPEQLFSRTGYVLNPQGGLQPPGATGSWYVEISEHLHTQYLPENKKNSLLINAEFSQHILYRTPLSTRLQANGEVATLVQNTRQTRGLSNTSPLAAQQTLHSHFANELSCLRSFERPGDTLTHWELYCESEKVSATDIVNILRQHWQRLPHGYQILKALPRTAQGAIDHHQLPEPAQWQKHYVAPRNPLEQQLVDIWQASLGHNKIGVTDNYFALGGDSIRSIQLVADANKQGLAFAVKDLFAHPSVAELATFLSGFLTESGDSPEATPTQQHTTSGSHTSSLEAKSADSIHNYQPFSLLVQSEQAPSAPYASQTELLQALQPLVPTYSDSSFNTNDTSIEDAFPLSMMQQGMVLQTIKHRGQNLYENVQLYEFKGDYQAEHFQQVLQAQVQQHPLLRCVYALSLPVPVQIVLDELPLELSLYDHRSGSEHDAQQAIQNWMQQQQAQGIDVTQRLWRGAIHLLPNNRFVFGIILQHAMWDGWSLESFAAALYQGYASLCKSHAAIRTLPEPQNLPSYAHFIALEQAALNSAEQRQYWQQVVQQGRVPWWTGANVDQNQHATLHIPISQSASQQAIQLARQLGVQEKSLWSAVYLALLSLLDGYNSAQGYSSAKGSSDDQHHNDAVIGSIMTQGRPEIPNGDKIVGVFLNSLPLAVSTRTTQGNKTWAGFVQDVDAALRQQHAFRRYPISQIQRDNQLDFSGAVLNYTNWHVYYQAQNERENEQEQEQDPIAVPNKVGGFAQTDFLIYADAFKDEAAQQFGLHLTVNSQVFNADWQARIVGYSSEIIAHVLHRTHQTIDKNSLLSQREKRQLLHDWNQTGQAFDQELTNAQSGAAPAALASPPSPPHPAALHYWFEHAARTTPDAIAVSVDANESVSGDVNESVSGDARTSASSTSTDPEQLSYRELDRRATLLAGNIAACLYQDPEQAQTLTQAGIGICVTRSPNMLVAMLAVLKAGGYYIPLDPHFPSQRLSYMVQDSSMTAIISDRQAQKVCDLEAYDSEISQPEIREQEQTVNQQPLYWFWVDELEPDTPDSQQHTGTPVFASNPHPNSIAYQLYTSGSTGKPKGVMVSHHNAINFLLSMQDKLRSDSFHAFAPQQPIWLAVTTLSFDIALLELMLPLMMGARIEIASKHTTLDGHALQQQLITKQVSVMQATPVTWQLIAEALSQGSAQTLTPSGNQLTALVGGEALPESLARFLQPQVDRLINLYGPTETTVWSLMSDLSQQVQNSKNKEEAENKEENPLAISIGHPIANTQCYVLDANLDLCPIGAPGELYIGGSGVAMGYANRAGLSAERFIPNPFASADSVNSNSTSAAGSRLYRTGDLVRYLPNTQDKSNQSPGLHFIGRVDHQVKVRGFRIELGEVEQVLRAHPAVNEAVALVYQPPQDTTAAQLLAWVTANAKAEKALQDGDEQSTLIHELLQHCRARLPDYMVPRRVQILPALPLTNNAKIDRNALLDAHRKTGLDQAVANQPASNSNKATRTKEISKTATETRLAGLWQQVLGLTDSEDNAAQLHPLDNFFDLGGYSILIARLAGRISEEFAVNIAIADLFQHVILRDQAVCIEQHLAGSDAAQEASLSSPFSPEPPEPIRHLLTEDQKASGVPVSFAQQRMWFLQAFMGANSVYNLPVSLRLRGAANASAQGMNSRHLIDCLQHIIRRHDSLRTRFAMQQNNGTSQLLQVISPSAPALQVERVTSAQELLEIALAERDYRFDLSHSGDSEPLCRIRLLEDASANSPAGPEYLLLVNLHHSIGDAMSLEIFSRELFTLYQHAPGEFNTALSPLTCHYADYSQWQRQRLLVEATGFNEPLETKPSALYQQQLQYWQQQLAGLPEALSIATDRPRQERQTYAGAIAPVTIPAALANPLRALSRRENATLYMTLLSAFGLLLSRYSGQSDLAIGTPASNRPFSEAEEMIGLFVNTLVIRCNLNEVQQQNHSENHNSRATFGDLLAHVKHNCVQAFANQDIPFEVLVEQLVTQRDTSITPLFQVMFSLQSSLPASNSQANSNTDSNAQPKAATFTATPLAAEFPELAQSPNARFDMWLTLQENTQAEQGDITGGLEYNTDLFNADTIARFVQHFLGLLTSLVANADPCRALIHTLPLPANSLDNASSGLSVSENFSATTHAQQPECLLAMVQQQALRTPDAIALIDYPQPVNAGVCRQLSYGQLITEVNLLAARIQQQQTISGENISSGTNIGICLPRSADLVIAMLAIHRVGGCYVPLDPGFPAERLAYMIDNSQMRLVISHRSVNALAVNKVPTLWLDDNSSLAVQKHAQDHLPDLIPNQFPKQHDSAYVIYTSGSTGKPKGVQISHHNCVNFIRSMAEKPGIGASNRLLSVTTCSFDIALLELFLPLTHGACSVIANQDTSFSGSAIANLLEQQHINMMQATPVTWQMLLDAGWRSSAHTDKQHTTSGKPADFCALTGGEALPPGLAQQLLPKVTALWNLYGPTETTVWSSLYQIQENQPVLIGDPVANTSLYVLDPHHNLCPIGVPGELYIGGEGVGQGYWRMPGKTAEQFLPNPFSNNRSERLYRTGDIVVMQANGSLRYVSRADLQVKLRGFRIEPGEIAHVLSEHSSVAQSVVQVCSRNGRDYLAAWFTLDAESGQQELHNTLREHAASALPAYMVPEVFIALDTMPLTPNGKIDRKALPEPTSPENSIDSDSQTTDSQSTSSQLTNSQTRHTPPDTATEQAVAAIWAEALQRQPHSIGKHDNFFSLGGHSLLMIQVLQSVTHSLQVELSVSLFFENPTLAQFAQLIDLLSRTTHQSANNTENSSNTGDTQAAEPFDTLEI